TMSIPVSFLNVPEIIMESAYFATDKSKSRKNGNGALMPLSFPQSNVALWDPTPQGKPVCLHMAQFRNPRLLILEKTLRLAHRHANQFGGKPQSAFLIGSLTIDNDEEGITVTVDRFDPGRETPGGPGTVMPTALLPGDFLISMCVGPARAGSDKTAMHSRDDFLAAFKSLDKLASSREASDPGRLLLARAVLEGAPSGPGALALSLSLAAVVVARTVLAAPVRPLPIIPTALARNLAGPASIARVQAACKSGFLTMDQTRKLLLILESDPKAQSLPLVGIWVSGVMHVANPHVWACCLRFFFGTFIRQRLLAEGSRCLLLVYTLTHSEPEFYECSLTSGLGLDFNLYSCSETLHVFKDVEAAERPPVQLELAPDRRCGEWGCFKGALGSAPGLGVGEGPASPGQRSLPSDNDSGLEEEDFSPRPTPSPHPNTQLSPKVHPCVPELSLVCDGTFL
uniref:STIL N-terminal domain-containing protein n=1 Tax=Petromyzon marinus TaxID=7757 RepID=S4RI50_PETMA